MSTRAVESTFRSLNNLLERFHQSFFLYIMTSISTFVTVGNYLAAPVLISAGMTVMGLSMWRVSNPSSRSLGPKLRTSGFEVKMERPIGQAVAIIGLTHLIGAGMFVFVTSLDPTRYSHVRFQSLTVLFSFVFIFIFILKRSCWFSLNCPSLSESTSSSPPSSSPTSSPSRPIQQARLSPFLSPPCPRS